MATSDFEAIQSGQYKKKKKYASDFEAIQDGSYKDYDFTPTGESMFKNKKDGIFDNWFKAGAFSDGYQFGDISKTILGSAADVGLGVVEGIMSGGEGIGDWLSYRTADVLDLFGGDEAADNIRKNANINATNELFGVLKKKGNVEENSLLGSKADSISNAMGTILTMTSTAGLGGAAGLGKAGQTVLSMGSMGLGSAGSGESEALQSGATTDEARLYGAISGAGEVFSEMLFGGLGKGAKAIGISKGLSSADDMLAKTVSDKFKSRLAKNLSQYAIKSGAEGVEEVISGIIQAAGKKLTYMSEEDLGELLQNEKLLDQFIVGTISSGISQTPGLVKTTAKGQDFLTGYTKNEQKVFDTLLQERIEAEQSESDKPLTKKQLNTIEERLKQDFEKGYIGGDKIFDALGYGEVYNNLKTSTEDSLGRPLNSQELEEVKREADEQFASTLSQNDNVIMKNLYEDDLRHQKFSVDLDSLDDDMKKFYQTQIDEGVVDNSTKSHNYIDMMAKIWKDKGIMSHIITDEMATKTLIDDAVKKYMEDNNITSLTTEQRQELENKYKEEFKNTRVNGYMRDGELYININSKNALETIVGHEITHLLEKNTDLYDNLRKSLKEYAESKGEYKNRLDAIKNQPGYNNLIEDAQTKELTADLVGDYIFTSQDYINSLAQNRNLFQKIYDEIKYLVKQVTAGSDEQRKLNKAVKMFEKAYKEMSVKLAEQENSTQPKFSITQDSNGNDLINIDVEQKQFDNLSLEEQRKLAKEILNNKYNGLLNGNVNLTKRGIREYTNPQEKISNTKKRVKYRLATELNDLYKVAKKINNELIPNDNSHKYHDFAKDGWNYYYAKFKFGDKEFIGKINEGISNGTPSFYNITDIYTPEEYKKMTENGTLNNNESTLIQSFLGNNISPINENVKLSLSTSLQENDINTTTDINNDFFKEHESDFDKNNGKSRILYDNYGNKIEQTTNVYKLEKGNNLAKLSTTLEQNVDDNYGKLYIEELYVKNKGEGLGTEIINSLKQYAKENNLDLYTMKELGNPKTQKFWNSVTEQDFGLDRTSRQLYSPYQPGYNISKTDNNGNKLSYQQRQYFKDSKVVDENRNLEVVYHQTKNDFTEFKNGFSIRGFKNANFFTNQKPKQILKNMLEGYVKINNPLYLENTSIQQNIVDDAIANGYDGIINQNVQGIEGKNEIVTFNSNQFKNIDNTNPTNSPDIRYSLTQKVDAELDDLTDEQYEYFKNTKAVNQNGELDVVYHGTPHEFSVFDIEKAGETGLAFGNGFYFTNSKGSAMGYTDGGVYGDSYDQVKEGYVNIEKPASRDTKTMTYNDFYNLYNALNENPNMYDDEMGMSNIDALLSDYGDIYNDKENTIKKFYDSYDDDVSLIDNLSYIGNPTEMYKTLRDVTGYDGIIPENPVSYDSFEKFYIAFNPDQFKLKSNKTPTDNVDMNLSLSNIDDVAPVRKPGLTYGEDIAYQEDIAPTDVDYTIDRDIMDLFHQEIERKGGKKVQLTKPVIAKEKSGLRNSLDTLSTMFVNQNTEIDNLAKESGNKNIKFAGDMLNNYSAEAQNDITVAQTDNYGNAIGKSVQQLFEPAKAKGLEAAFNDYLINYSNIDRWARGKGSQTPVDVSERLVANYEEQHPEFKKWAKDVWKFGENVRKNWLEAGMIKQSMYDLLSESYPHYVPYISDTNSFDATMDKLKELKARPIKRAVGGATELFPVEEALTRYTFAQKRAYRQNELFKQIYNTLQTNPGQRGADVGEGYFTGEEPNLFRDDSGNYITALFDGEEHNIQISDDLFKSLRNDMQTQIKDLEKKLSLITKPLQAFSDVRRKMLTSWRPSFALRNPIKDIQDAFFNSKHLKEMARNYVPGIKELWTGSTPEARQFLALYGEGNLMGQFANESGLYDAKKGNKNNKFLKGLSKVNNIMELAPRYAEFKASLQAGESLAESMYNAREITTNFSRGGVITKALNRNGFTFLNASVQGFDKFIRNFSGENGARGIASSLLRAVMLGVVPAVFNELAFGGGDDKDEDYDALPDYIKDNYYLIKTGDGSFVRIPKGRMLSVFGSAARRTIELAEGEENAFEGYLSNVNNQIGINNPEENNIFSPLLQAYGSKNGNAWYGGDIVPTRLQDKPKNEQYDASTDKFSIWLSNTALGKKMGLSPYKVNYVLDQYSGGIGDILLPYITDEAKNKGGFIAPIVSEFTTDSTTNNKYVSDFYTKNDELKVKANSSEATDDDYLRNEYMKSISKEMSQLYAERRNIQADNSLSKSEKYEKSQAIKEQINKLAKDGLDSYDNISRTGNFAQVGDDMGYYKNAKGNWTPIDQKDIEATESIGLTDREKSTYYGIKNDMYNIDQKYEPKLKTASDEEKTVLNAQKKVDIINSIKNANLPDEAKAKLYDKKYASTETLDAVINCGIDFDSYLDLQAQNFTADKNIYGKTINGSKKNKVYNYINNLNMPYEQKIMLAKLEYKSDDTYNREIIDYLNNDNSISYQDMTEILKAMGFKVDEYGNITWE